MAYSLFEQLKEDALKCALCFEVPGDGGTENIFKYLRCHHIFCKNCLEKLVKPGQQITCPNCREETVLDSTAGSVNKLPSASHVTDVIDWINNKQVKELKGQTIDRQCPEHKVQINFFCIDCNEYVCGDCLTLTHDREHTSLYIKTEAGPIREAIKEMIKDIECQVLHWKKAEDQKNKIIGRINADAANAKALLNEYTDRVRKALESKRASLMKSVGNEQMEKLHKLRKEKAAITQQMVEIEFKMAKARRSLEQADDYDVFKERIAIGKIHKEVLAKPPPTLNNQTLGILLRFSPNLISFKRLQSDLMRIGTVHTSNESLIRVKNILCKNTPQSVLECMESAVKEAYALDVYKLTQNEDRRTKARFIMNRLEEVFHEKWSCFIGDFSCCSLQLQEQTHALYAVNDSDKVLIFKNMPSAVDLSKEPKSKRTSNVKQDNISKDQAKILHSSYDKKADSTALECVQKSLDSSSTKSFNNDTTFNTTQDVRIKIKAPKQSSNLKQGNFSGEVKIIHSSYDEIADSIALECVQRNLDGNKSFTTDTAFNIAQDFSTRMKAPWQCIIHNCAMIGLSREHIQKMKSDTPSMITVRADGKDVWLLKMISFN
ncbi:uncharacterized protein LOC117109440 [Anneissia japonica]|uniref:uncharacterized protein LOC117109440 n=1 Tax=Anneissia japonica TaxID=1529436 RepID=UPI0014257771|nr:uncharacterized protein LOC117109440 [Anneissia japonica]